MRNFLKSIKKIVSLMAIGAAIYGLTGSGANALASGPVFNRLPGDLEFTMGRTQNQSTYSDPVSATINDRVTVAVYYHNNTQDTTAENVTFRTQLPSGVAAKHVIRTTLSADNAESITDTMSNGQITGAPDLTINLDQAAAVSYVPGTTYWYPDIMDNPNQPGIPMPDGIAGNGLTIGKVAGCWSHAGFVLFDVAFSQNPKLETDKFVSVFGGQNVWSKANTAKPGDELIYQIYFTNPGNVTAKNVRVIDTFPTELTYKAGSVFLRTKDANNNDVDTMIPDSKITLAGNVITIPLGDVLPGLQHGGYVHFVGKIKDLSVGTHVLTNTEQLVADNVPGVSASAGTTVTVSQTASPDVKILKEVANLTQGSNRWVKENTAKPGDRMQYRLTVYNQGTGPADNISVKDTLPAGITYVNGSTKIFNATDPNNGQALPDGVVGNGVAIGTVQNGIPMGNRYIIFDVYVSNNLPQGTQDLINKADVFMGGVLKDSSTAKTTVTSEVGLLITKQVWNASQSQWVTKLDGVKPGDIITYRILIRNTGNTTIMNPVIHDQLPNSSIITYIRGSSRQEGIPIGDEWIIANAGLSIANQTPGNNKEITFQVKIGACPPGGTFTLTNTAMVQADGVSQKTATADIVVTAGPPPIPR